MANFSSKNEGTWFWFNKAKQDQGGICLRELSIDQANSIERDTTTSKNKAIRGRMVEQKKQDTAQAFLLTMQYCIVDWENVQLDGVDAECNAMNKARMMKSLDFVKFITEALDQLSESNDAVADANDEDKLREEEERVKNLGSSSPGDLEQ